VVCRSRMQRRMRALEHTITEGRQLEPSNRFLGWAISFKNNLTTTSSIYHNMPQSSMSSFGPLSASDAEIAGLSKTAALKKIKTRLREYLLSISGKRPPRLNRHQKGHRECIPRLCLGGGSRSNAGRWYQLVYYFLLGFNMI
jgi:hypothetical protein